MSIIFNKRISKEIKQYEKQEWNFPNAYIRFNENNMKEWFFIVHSLDDEYKNGIYFAKLILHEEYPFKPGDFIFITPSGRFKTNNKICTDFTGYHPENYSSSWNVSSLIQAIISFMTEKVEIKHQNVGSIYTTELEKKDFAKKSEKWNLNNDLFNSIFPDYSEIKKKYISPPN